MNRKNKPILKKSTKKIESSPITILYGLFREKIKKRIDLKKKYDYFI